MLKAAIIGFGGISKSHRNAYSALKDNGIAELVAAYDIDPAAFEKDTVINIASNDSAKQENINFYTDIEEMISNEAIDFIDICTPTFVHKDLAVDMLNRGYNVMCEKPMALNYEDCKAMLDAAERNKKHLMIGQCVRFNGASAYLKAAIEDNRYGKVTGAFFSRLSTPPTWGYNNWFMSPELSGGCLTDLHIHDVDLIRYLFGEPKRVSCVASTSICVNDTVHSSFDFDGKAVSAVGDWTLLKMPFSAGWRVNFEKATLVLEGGELKIYPKDGAEPFVQEVDKRSMYYLELEYFAETVAGNINNEINTPRSASESIRLIERMRESISKNGDWINL